MLVITRKSGQRVRLLLPSGEAIWILVEKDVHSGTNIRLGIDAPASVVIAREELLRPAKETPSA